MIDLLLYIAAFVCFVAAAIGRPASRVNFVGLGLALWVLTLVLDGLSVGVK